MPVMDKLRMFVGEEPVIAASCLIAGFGLFLPAVVRPILDSFDSVKQVPQPALSDVVAGIPVKSRVMKMVRNLAVSEAVLCNVFSLFQAMEIRIQFL